MTGLCLVHYLLLLERGLENKYFSVVSNFQQFHIKKYFFYKIRPRNQDIKIRLHLYRSAKITWYIVFVTIDTYTILCFASVLTSSFCVVFALNIGLFIALGQTPELF